MLFNAVTVFRVTFLSPVVRRDGESSEAFCARVRAAIVATLQASAPDETVECALERPKTEQRAGGVLTQRGRRATTTTTGGSASGGANSKRLARLVQQVREVLPDTPASLVQADLGEHVIFALRGICSVLTGYFFSILSSMIEVKIKIK